MNKYKQTNTGYIEEIIPVERYKKHRRGLFITAFHEKKTFGFRPAQSVSRAHGNMKIFKQASEVFLKILKSLSKQNP